jgi:hypothetical protein
MDAAISAILAAVDSTPSMIFRSEESVCSLSVAPSATRAVDSLMRLETSRAAWFER